MMTLKNRNLINSLVWHELGHLCVGLMIINQDNDYTINKVFFKYKITGPEKGITCGVNCKSPFINSVSDLANSENLNNIYFEVLNHFAGAVFESVYRKKVEISDVNLTDILLKGSAINDFCNLKKLIAEYCPKTEIEAIREKLKNYALSYFYSIIVSNDFFIEETQKIAQKYTSQIIDLYDDKSGFELILDKGEINLLSTNMFDLLNSSGIYKELLDLKDFVATLVVSK